MPLERQEQRKGAYIFGIIFLVVIIVIAIFIPHPSYFQYTVFRIVLALAAAGVIAMVPGFFDLEIGNILRAGGAGAVFATVFFFSPANLVVQPPGPLESEVTLDAGTYDTVELIETLNHLTGGVSLEFNLSKKLEGRAVKISSQLNSVSLRSVLDRIFKEIGIRVDYAIVGETVVISEKGST